MLVMVDEKAAPFSTAPWLQEALYSRIQSQIYEVFLRAK